MQLGYIIALRELQDPLSPDKEAYQTPARRNTSPETPSAGYKVTFLIATPGNVQKVLSIDGTIPPPEAGFLQHQQRPHGAIRLQCAGAVLTSQPIEDEAQGRWDGFEVEGLQC